MLTCAPPRVLGLISPSTPLAWSTLALGKVLTTAGSPLPCPGLACLLSQGNYQGRETAAGPEFSA